MIINYLIFGGKCQINKSDKELSKSWFSEKLSLDFVIGATFEDISRLKAQIKSSRVVGVWGRFFGKIVK